MTGDSLNASIDMLAITLDSSIVLYYNSISKKVILDMCQRAIRCRSYWVISCVIIYILFWSVMLFYVMLCSVVLCYYLYIIPYIKSKCLSVSLERLHEPYQTYSVTSNSTKNNNIPVQKNHAALPQHTNCTIMEKGRIWRSKYINKLYEVDIIVHKSACTSWIMQWPCMSRFFILFFFQDRKKESKTFHAP